MSFLSLTPLNWKEKFWSPNTHSLFTDSINHLSSFLTFSWPLGTGNDVASPVPWTLLGREERPYQIK